MKFDLDVLNMAQSMATHAAARQSVIARNVAHADTPGFKARDTLSFSESYQSTHDSFSPRATRSAHMSNAPYQGRPFDTFTQTQQGAESPNGNTVSLETEMTKAADVRLQHELALGIYRKSIGILRLSLGKSR